MSSFIRFRKEFEDVILKGNIEEALKTLPPNSDEDVYLRFCEEYKKCCADKTITKELELILKDASKKSNNLGVALEARKLLLEYDLPSTSQEKKNEIINKFLNDNYSRQSLNYDAPYFVRVKKNQNDQKSETKNKTPIELTEKLINKAIEEDINRNNRDKAYKIKNTPEKKRIKLFLEILEKDPEQCMKIIESNMTIPFYFMTKDEFAKVIELFNKAKAKLKYFNCNNLTIEQIERLIKEVNNPLFVEKTDILQYLMNKKYNKLLKKAEQSNDLDKLKEILWEIYKLYESHSKEITSGILLYILKINREQNIKDIKTFIEYLKNPFDQNYYHNIINIPSIDFDEIKNRQFIEDLLIDFFIYDKAKVEDFKKYFKQEYLEKIECISKMYKGEEVKPDVYSSYLSDAEYEKILKKI
jgi:hypothetical protein